MPVKILSDVCSVEGCGLVREPNGSTRHAMCYGHRARKRRSGADFPGGPLVPHAANGSEHVDADGYVQFSSPMHPLSRVGGSVLKHRVVLYDKIGPGEHLCHWGCGKLLAWEVPFPDGIQGDHLDGDRQNNDPDNLVPACGPCNTRRSFAGNPTEWSSV